MKEKGEELVKQFNGTDKLEAIFEIHKKLQEYGNVKPMDLNTREGQEQFRKMAEYATEELMEAVGCLKIRDWTQTELPVDYDHFKEEFVDSLGFHIQMWKLAGLTPDDILRTFCEKFAVNDFRGNSHY